MRGLRPYALVRGVNDVASAVALRLHEAGYAVVLEESPAPAVTRRGQSFADALFEGVAQLAGVMARRESDVAHWARNGAHDIAVCALPLDAILAALQPEVLVDARMRTRAIPESQRGRAPLVIGLGPSFVAGGNVDLAVETAWGGGSGQALSHGRNDEAVSEGSRVFGVAERPARIAAGVQRALLARFGLLPLGRAAIAGVLRNAQAGELSLYACTLGLNQRGYRDMLETCLPGAAAEIPDISPAYMLCLAQTPALFDPLARLIEAHQAPDMGGRPARWLARAIAAAGFGQRHLWQDLGLSCRAETSRLIALHFPALAEGNHADLKWKRYLFQTLGRELGIADLNPPACGGCDSYATCVGAAP
ncbi:MAG TPA: nitrogen fixation protein NifQ [Thiobacillaceae bacterium]|nr:nitrogen fixation protein NifQ [Thiobacillaceae bacterium]HNU65438.1 nitrogen fixation protein NifQ [Thiobacillaceae bacterium]